MVVCSLGSRNYFGVLVELLCYGIGNRKDGLFKMAFPSKNVVAFDDSSTSYFRFQCPQSMLLF